VLKGQFFDIMG